MFSYPDCPLGNTGNYVVTMSGLRCMGVRSTDDDCLPLSTAVQAELCRTMNPSTTMDIVGRLTWKFQDNQVPFGHVYYCSVDYTPAVLDQTS